MANMIHGVENLQIRNANMAMYINQNQPDEEKKLMSILTNQCTLTAQFDSKERYKPPRCAESTRENILKKLRDWVENSSSNESSLFWLHGGAGAGKSALAQSLAEQMKETNNLAGSFFFFSIDASRNNADRLFPTLIYQLAKLHSGFETNLINQLKKNQDIFNKPRDYQFKSLFVDPLLSLPQDSILPRLFIIDGLDECKDSDAQSDILSILAQYIPLIPFPLRFLVASRPEGHINRSFDTNRFIKQLPSLLKYDLSKDSDASKDIHTFLKREFDNLSHPIASILKDNGWPTEREISILVDRSSGHFVYPATVMKYLESNKHRPDDRLEIVLGLTPRGSKDQPFSQLDALYVLILQDVEQSQFISIKRSFSILYLISEKVGYFSIYRSGSSRIIQDMLLLRPGDLDLLFDPLRSLVAQETEEENLHVFHKTLFDFFLDSERSGRFGLNKLLCHESAALYMLNTDILTSWSYAPDFMYFAYHCYLAQPITDARLIRFLENLDILYTSAPPSNPSIRSIHSLRFQNEKALLNMFIEEGEQAPGAKTIFYLLRMLSLLTGFKEDLHVKHCTKMVDFYTKITPRASVNGTLNPSSSSSSDGEEGEKHAALDKKISSKLSSWQPSADILSAITAASAGDTSTADRDTLIKLEHSVLSSFSLAQHVSSPSSPYRLQSTLLPSPTPDTTTTTTAKNVIIAHSYHIFTVSYEGDPYLMVLVATYSRGGKGGVGVVVEAIVGVEDGVGDGTGTGTGGDGAGVGGVGRRERKGGKGPGAVVSTAGFDISLLSDEEFEEQVDKFLGDHVLKVEKELGQVVDDSFESKFEF